MQLLELSLHNYKVHRKKVIEFKPGVVGIVGDNGTGKSSIITAICFLFTGEYDTSKKGDCITLGETEGWVKGRFLLNGKEGTLERHLTGSKVVLTYDGVTYNKVSEVSQLWNDLLQIDSTIFNNVIVAKQGEIQNLFSDESAVREKIFQKIFMVPPTEKIRSVIWDNYVKLAPPEKPEEDVLQLQTLQASTASERNQILRELDQKVGEIGDPTQVRCINDRISFLERCQIDLIKKPEIETKIQEFTAEFDENKVKIQDLDDYLNKETPVQTLIQDREVALGIKPVYERKCSLVKEIAKLAASIAQVDAVAKTKQATEIDETKEQAATTIIELNGSLKEVVAKKSHLLSLKGHAVCPTCYQGIPDASQAIQRFMDEEVRLKAKLGQANTTHSTLSKESQTLWSELTKVTQLQNRIGYLEDEKRKVDYAEFSQEHFDLINQQISVLESFIEANEYFKNRQNAITGELRVLRERLNGLDIYDGENSIDVELLILKAAIDAYTARQSEVAALQLHAGKLEHELLLLDTRIATSETNHKYNTIRKEYLGKLDQVYDIFGVSKFPRKLISTYMASVQASLSSYLEYFGLNYIVKVEDGFKIRLYNEDSNTALPTVSGGQEMMIGICLRLALHKMFAQAFPIWIIDEGTTHLSDSKKQSYFDLINALRKQKIINQIIVIDHDERLSTVVDQTVQL